MERKKQELVTPHSFSAWMHAARPKTLTGAATPVLIGIIAAYADLLVEEKSILWIPAALCFLFAFIMQIDANFINDYYDFKKGTDNEERLGPKRVCMQGWISMKNMLRAIIITTLLAAGTGLPLIIWGGYKLIIIGFLCILCCFMYTLWFSYKGLGDILVLLFFGIIPVCATYYIQTGNCPVYILFLSIACGLVTDCLLLVNNFRDRFTDKKTNKITLVVRIGGKATLWLYLSLGPVALTCLLPFLWIHKISWSLFIIALLFLPFHWQAYSFLKKTNQGKELNTALGYAARNIFLFGIFISIITILFA